MRNYLIIAIFFVLIASSLFSKQYSYSWNFHGQKYSISFDGNRTIYEQYLNDQRPSSTKQPKESYYQEFLKTKAGDNLIAGIASDLKYYARQTAMTDKQLADLVIAFVQCLPYNYNEAGEGKIAICDFPYVTMIRGTGTCLDKAILGVALLKELSFSVAMIHFYQIPINETVFNEHVIIGFETKSSLAFFGGGKYCYVEVDKPTITGLVPKVISYGYLAPDQKSVNLNHNRRNAELLGPYKIYLASSGKLYNF